MLKNGTILVPLDGSALSERSLAYATSMSQALDARLALMIAAYISDIPSHGPWTDEMVSHPRDTCTAYLTSVRERISAPEVDLIVKVGYPHESILEAAKETNASLIVLSTHGRSGVSRWAYGSTAGHLLHESHVPLLVIGKNAAASGTDGYHPKHIVAPLDGSELSERALPQVRELAGVFGAKISLVRVAPYSVEAYPMAVPQMYWPDLDRDLIAGATAYLERVREGVGVPVDLHVLQGPPAEMLLGFAERNAADLFVLSTHGRAGLQRAILGSTADRLLEGPAPVLMLRPEGV